MQVSFSRVLGAQKERERGTSVKQGQPNKKRWYGRPTADERDRFFFEFNLRLWLKIEVPRFPKGVKVSTRRSTSSLARIPLDFDGADRDSCFKAPNICFLLKPQFLSVRLAWCREATNLKKLERIHRRLARETTLEVQPPRRQGRRERPRDFEGAHRGRCFNLSKFVFLLKLPFSVCTLSMVSRGYQFKKSSKGFTDPWREKLL